MDALRAVGECGGGNAIALLRAEHYVGTFVLAASAAFCPLSSESDCSLPPSLGGPDLQPMMLSALADYLLAYETPAPAAAGQPPSGQGLPELDMAEETVLRAVLQVVADTLAVGADGQQWRRTLAAEELDGLAQAIANGLQVGPPSPICPISASHVHVHMCPLLAQFGSHIPSAHLFPPLHLV